MKEVAASVSDATNTLVFPVNSCTNNSKLIIKYKFANIVSDNTIGNKEQKAMPKKKEEKITKAGKKSGNITILEHTKKGKDKVQPATPTFEATKIDFKTGQTFVDYTHSISPVVENLHDKVFRIDNWRMDSPLFSEANQILSYMGLNASSYNPETKKITRSNGTEVSIKKIDPYGTLQKAFANLNKPLYMTITGSEYARALRLPGIKKHYSTLRSRCPNFSNEKEQKFRYNRYLGGFNYDGLLLLSDKPDFSNLSNIKVSAQIKCLIKSNKYADLISDEPELKKKRRELRNATRTKAENILITDILGSRDITRHKAIFAKLLKKAYDAVEQEGVTIWYSSDESYKTSDLVVLNYGYIPKKNKEALKREKNKKKEEKKIVA